MPGKNSKKQIKFFRLGLCIITCLLLLLTNFSAAKALTAEGIFHLVNDYRIREGVDPLIINGPLVNAAKHRASDMNSRNYFDHNSPDGITPWQIAEQFGYNYLYIGENLAQGFLDSQEVLQKWASSQAHLSNILNTQFAETGIAVIEQSDGFLIVQLFGQRANEDLTKTYVENLVKSTDIIPENASLENETEYELSSAAEYLLETAPDTLADYYFSIVPVFSSG